MPWTSFSDTAFAMPLPVAVTLVGIAAWAVSYLALHDSTWLGRVAGVVFIVGAVATLVAIAVLAASFIALCLVVAAVLLFMSPLFLLGGASGVADRRPHRWDRDYHRSDYYRRDYY